MSNQANNEDANPLLLNKEAALPSSKQSAIKTFEERMINKVAAGTHDLTVATHHTITLPMEEKKLPHMK